MVLGNFAAALAVTVALLLQTAFERPSLDGVKRVLVIGGSGQLGTAIAARWHDFEDRRTRARRAPDRTNASVWRRRWIGLLPACSQCRGISRRRSLRSRAAAGLRDQRPRGRGRGASCGRARHALRDGQYRLRLRWEERRAVHRERMRPIRSLSTARAELAGERLVEAAGGRAFVVRTCGVYGASRSPSRRPTFIERILRQASQGDPVRVVADVIASPTYSNDLADALHALAGSEAYGLYHAAGAGSVSWFDFAQEAARPGPGGVADRADRGRPVESRGDSPAVLGARQREAARTRHCPSALARRLGRIRWGFGRHWRKIERCGTPNRSPKRGALPRTRGGDRLAGRGLHRRPFDGLGRARGAAAPRRRRDHRPGGPAAQRRGRGIAWRPAVRRRGDGLRASYRRDGPRAAAARRKHRRAAV